MERKQIKQKIDTELNAIVFTDSMKKQVFENPKKRMSHLMLTITLIGCSRFEEKEADEIIGICLEAYVTHAFGGRTLSDKGCPDEYEKADRQDDLEMIPEHEKLIQFCEKVEAKKSGV